MMIPPLYIKTNKQTKQVEMRGFVGLAEGKKESKFAEVCRLSHLERSMNLSAPPLFSQTQQLDFSRFRHTLKYTETDKVTHLQSYKDRSMLIGLPKHPRLDFLYDHKVSSPASVAPE